MGRDHRKIIPNVPFQKHRLKHYLPNLITAWVFWIYIPGTHLELPYQNMSKKIALLSSYHQVAFHQPLQPLPDIPCLLSTLNSFRFHINHWRILNQKAANHWSSFWMFCILEAMNFCICHSQGKHFKHMQITLGFIKGESKRSLHHGHIGGTVQAVAWRR